MMIFYNITNQRGVLKVKNKIMKRAGSVVLALSMLAGGAAAMLPVTAESSIEVRAADSYKTFGDFKYVVSPYENTIAITDYTGKSTDVVIPKTIEGKKVTSVTLPDSFDTVGHAVFAECTTLKKVVLPQSVTGLMSYSFLGSTSLEEVNIPDKVDWIGEMVFSGTAIKTIRIPKGVESITNSTFSGCRKLTDVVLSEGLTGIYLGAFNNCVNLKKIVIPASVKHMDTSGLGFKNWKMNNGSVSGDKISGFTIYGTPGTAAQSYAKKYGFKFVDVKNVPIESVNLNMTSTTIGVKETVNLKATINPYFASGTELKWRTSDSKVLKVDSSGKVTTVGTGTAWITARTVNGKEKSCKITVKKAPDKITLTKGVLTLGVGEKYTLGSSVNDGAASSQRTYRTSNSSIVKMTRTSWVGDFVAQKPGVAYVTVKSYNGKESTCKVTVKAAPTKVTLNKTSLTLKVGQSASLSANVGNSGCATRTFRTSNSSVVKMTKTSWTGEFKAVKKGVAYVTVRTYNGKEASCKVTVV